MARWPDLKICNLGLGAALGLLISSGALAQTGAAASLERQTEEAFRRVMQQPQDLSGWAQYAQLLIQAGNYEGGIAALERLLLEPGASPELRVDVAALYYRLASYLMAQSMLQDAIADVRLQGSKRVLAETLLADSIKRNQRSQLSGAVTFGLRHQTNPTYRSDSGLVLSAGVLNPLAANQRPNDDTDISLGLRVQHLYNLGRQNSATISTNFSAYLVDYRSSSGRQLQVSPTTPQDLQVLDLNTGLQFKPFPLADVLVRPHIILSNLVVQRHQYLRNQGLGLDLSWRPNEKTFYELTLDWQDRDFANRVDITNADLLDGRFYGLRGRVSREVGPGQVVSAEYALRRNQTERAFYDYDSHDVRVTYSVSYASPIAKEDFWTTAVWVSALNRSYGGPDASVSARDTRKDRESRMGISHTMPLASQWSLLLIAEHSRNRANLPNFRYKNTSLSGAVVRSF